jgi:hypothetical protein
MQLQHWIWNLVNSVAVVRFFMFNVMAEFYVQWCLLCEAYLLHILDMSFPLVFWFFCWHSLWSNMRVPYMEATSFCPFVFDLISSTKLLSEFQEYWLKSFQKQLWNSHDVSENLCIDNYALQQAVIEFSSILLGEIWHSSSW